MNKEPSRQMASVLFMIKITPKEVAFFDVFLIPLSNQLLPSASCRALWMTSNVGFKIGCQEMPPHLLSRGMWFFFPCDLREAPVLAREIFFFQGQRGVNRNKLEICLFPWCPTGVSKLVQRAQAKDTQGQAFNHMVLGSTSTLSKLLVSAVLSWTWNTNHKALPSSTESRVVIFPKIRGAAQRDACLFREQSPQSQWTS